MTEEHQNDHGHGSSQSLVLTNQLSTSSSPYLRAHKDNPVAWQEWTSESVALAKQHERMIFLSIGYSACHWCHVMERESFSSPEVAGVLNQSFIPIKIDRESRPDLDDVYMNYVTATTGSGGWPLNVFLTPSLQPVFGGTYWPSPSSAVTMPSDTDEKVLSFFEVLTKMETIWRDERDRCLQSAADITKQLQEFSAEGLHSQSSVHVKGVEEEDPSEPLDLDLLDDAVDHFVSIYDKQYGGFNIAPKFPTPANLTMLLRIGASITYPSTLTRFGFPAPVPAILGKKSCMTAASMSLYTLLSMSRSALRDQLGYGFHRYSVTRDWNLPHFEKMTCDNAQLLSVYCDAWALGRDPEILGTIYDLVEYFTNSDSPIVRPDGGWYSSESADSQPSSSNPSASEHNEEKEGAYYVWTLKELQTLLGDHNASIVARHFGVREHGNVPSQHDVNDEFVGQNVLYVAATPSVLAKEFGLKEGEVVKAIKKGKKKLQEHQEKSRGRPSVDNKVICGWNGLVISALARAANTLVSIDESRATRCKNAAIKAVDFISSKMYNETTEKLTRIYSDAAAADVEKDLAFVDDYAYLIHGLIKLFDVTIQQPYIDLALKLQSTLDRDFYATKSGGYLQAAVAAHTPSTTPSTTQQNGIQDRILTLKPGTDSSLPSPNGITAQNLLYLSSYKLTLNPDSKTESQDLLFKARRTIDAFAPEIIQHPFLYASLLSAAVVDQVGVKSLIVPADMSDAEIETRALKGFGRTVVRRKTSSLPSIVPVPTSESEPTTTTTTPKDQKVHEILICTKEGICRPLRANELDEVIDMLDDNDEDNNKDPNTNNDVNLNNGNINTAATTIGGKKDSKGFPKGQEEVVVDSKTIEERERQAREEDRRLSFVKDGEGQGRPRIVDFVPGEEVEVEVGAELDLS